MNVRLEKMTVVKNGNRYVNFYIVNGDLHVCVKVAVAEDKQGYYRLKDWAEDKGTIDKDKKE